MPGKWVPRLEGSHPHTDWDPAAGWSKRREKDNWWSFALSPTCVTFSPMTEETTRVNEPTSASVSPFPPSTGNKTERQEQVPGKGSLYWCVLPPTGLMSDEFEEATHSASVP